MYFARAIHGAESTAFSLGKLPIAVRLFVLRQESLCKHADGAESENEHRD